jgi:hypothetical protein
LNSITGEYDGKETIKLELFKEFKNISKR